MENVTREQEPSDVEAIRLIALIHQVAMQDENALAALYDATVSRVYGLALRITQRRDLAEEVVSDVYLQVWRQAPQFDATRGSVLAWLMIRCRTRAIDTLRRIKSAEHNDLPDNLPDTDNTDCPQDLTLATEQQREVRRALESLNDKQRQLIALAFYRGMSHNELAEFTRMPLGTVKTLIRRGLATLRETLADAGIGLENTHEHSE